MDEFYNKHYIAIDERNRIINGFSDAFKQPTDSDICINEQGGYQFRLFPNGEENPILFTENGIPLYEWNDGVFARTEEAIGADEAALPVPEAEITAEDILLEMAAEHEYRISLIEMGVSDLEM